MEWWALCVTLYSKYYGSSLQKKQCFYWHPVKLETIMGSVKYSHVHEALVMVNVIKLIKQAQSLKCKSYKAKIVKRTANIFSHV